MTTRKLHFTKAKIDRLPIPDSGVVTYHDLTQPGLVLLVYSSGIKTFHVYKKLRNSSKSVKPKLGKVSEIDVDTARKLAASMVAKIAQGEDPTEERKEKNEDVTLGHLIDQYIKMHAKVNCTSWRDIELNITRYLGDWFEKPLSQIDMRDIQLRLNELKEEIGAPTANRSLDTLRAAYNYGIKYGICRGENPTKGIPKFHTEARDRYIKRDEFKKFMNVLREYQNTDIRDFVYLSLFTGARQANVLSMNWEDINFEEGTWRIPKTKNKDPHTVPLTPMALAVLNARKQYLEQLAEEKPDKHPLTQWVFPSRTSAVGHIVEPKVGWRQLLKEAGMKNLRMHDLRRTLGSYMAMGNQSLHMIGKALGHKSPRSTQIYAHIANDPIREAMTKAQVDMLAAGGLVPEDFIEQFTPSDKKEKGKS